MRIHDTASIFSTEILRDSQFRRYRHNDSVNAASRTRNTFVTSDNKEDNEGEVEASLVISNSKRRT